MIISNSVETLQKTIKNLLYSEHQVLVAKLFDDGLTPTEHERWRLVKRNLDELEQLKGNYAKEIKFRNGIRQAYTNRFDRTEPHCE